MRLFLAVEINQELASKISNNMKNNINGCKIKWVETENIHLTLHFLGDTQEDTYKKLLFDLEKVFNNENSFKLHISGKGVFPNLKKPRVIWAGCNYPEELKNIYNSSAEVLKNYNYEVRSKYTPHITIGRIKYIEDTTALKHYLNNDKEIYIGAQDVNYINLMESKLTKKGPEYSVCKKFLLQ